MRRQCRYVVFLLSLVLGPRAARAQPQSHYYVYDGKVVQLVREDPASAKYKRWQVWLYEFPVEIQNHTSGLPYSRWGLINGWSGVGVMKQLETYRGFEQVYRNFFGAGSWTWHTFLNPVGPIAIADQAIQGERFASPFELSELTSRLNRLVDAVEPSLQNNESEGPGSSMRGYFDQVADAVVKASELYSYLARNEPQPNFIDREIARIRTGVAQAEGNVPKITSVLPSVKLPTSSAWMSQTYRAGSDGTVEETVVETGSGVMIQQRWSGGDGAMAGTVVFTLLPFQNISQVQTDPPLVKSGGGWTVLIHSDRARAFQEIMTSPERKIATRTLRAVNYTSTKTLEYLTFPNSAQAQDAYAYFLYHKQLGR